MFQRQRFEYVETERDAKSGKARGEVREVETPAGDYTRSCQSST
jgi:hypothetical protein